MTTFHLNSLPKQKRIQMIGEFYDIIDSLKDRKEIRLFFKSLLSADEIATLMRRVEIAVLLSAGFTYDQIMELLSVGKPKIANVSKNLIQDDSGYKVVVRRLIENRKSRLRKVKNQEKKASDPLSHIKRTYKGHFLLINLLDAAIERLGENEIELAKEALLSTPSASFIRTNKKKQS